MCFNLVTSCDDLSCDENEICVKEGDTYQCICHPDYDGDDCEEKSKSHRKSIFKKVSVLRITSVATHLEKAFFFPFFLFLFLLLKEKLPHDFYMLKPFT